jgi:hypothetical protein
MVIVTSPDATKYLLATSKTITKSKITSRKTTRLVKIIVGFIAKIMS